MTGISLLTRLLDNTWVTMKYWFELKTFYYENHWIQSIWLHSVLFVLQIKLQIIGCRFSVNWKAKMWIDTKMISTCASFFFFLRKKAMLWGMFLEWLKAAIGSLSVHKSTYIYSSVKTCISLSCKDFLVIYTGILWFMALCYNYSETLKCIPTHGKD